MQKAVIYVRVSTDEQAKHGYSIDMQQNQCLNFAQSNNYQVTNIYIDDGYTAKNMNRPQLKKMLEDVKKRSNGISAVIAWRCDRVVRNNSNYFAKIIPHFEKYGILLLSATENNDMNTPYGRYIRNNQINNAELESGLTSIRTIENLKEKARQGYYPGAIVPIGYKRIEKNRKKIIIPDVEKAHFVKQLFELYATGLYTQKSLAVEMSKRGFTTKKNKPCDRKVVENILNNNIMFYIGKFYWTSTDPLTMGKVQKLYPGKHEAIIPFELYKTVLSVMGENTNLKVNTHDFLYKGLVKCQQTGKLFVGEKQRGEHKSSEYKYYRCHHCDLECAKECKKIIKEEVITETILEIFKSFHLSDEELKNTKADLKGILNYSEQLNEKRKSQIEGQLTKLKNRLNMLYEDKLDDVITEEIYFNKRETYQNQIDDLTLEYTALMKTNTEIMSRLDMMLELCKDLYGTYLRLSDEKKRELIKILCSNLFWDGSKLIITIKSAFSSLLKFALLKNGAGDGVRTHVYRHHKPRS